VTPAMFAVAGVSTCLAACGGVSSSSAPASVSATPTATPAPLPPLVVTETPPSSGSGESTIALRRLDGSTVASTNLSGSFVSNIDIAIGRSHVFVLEGNSVHELGRDGSDKNIGMVPNVQSDSTIDATARSGNLGIAVSPDESQMLFSIPISATSPGSCSLACNFDSQLFIGPLGGTAAKVADDSNDARGLLSPIVWTKSTIWMNTLGFGLGGAGPFFDVSAIGARTFDPSAHTLGDPSTCGYSDAGAILTNDDRACALSFSGGSTQNGPPKVTVYTSSGSTSVGVSQITSSAVIGAFRVSPDGTKLAFGVSSGTPNSNSSGPAFTYETHIVTLSTMQTVTVSGVVPAVWLPDGRLVVTASYKDGASSIVAASGGSPSMLTSDTVIGVLTG